MTRFTTAMAVRMTRVIPPAMSSPIRADRPTVVKNTTSSVSRAERSNASSAPANTPASVNKTEAISPPVTGSGTL